MMAGYAFHVGLFHSLLFAGFHRRFHNVLRRAQSLSRNPAEEGLVLVGYGSSEFGNIWEDLFANTGREAVRKGKFGGYATA
ncbi:MAG: hypothetical protein FJY09_02300 [Chlorobi bacterium]|nr:hypothetical protein [Chlorobiota bacterium]